MTYQYTMHKHRHKSSLMPKPDLKIESLTSLPQLRFDNGRVYYSETRQITDRFSYRHITNCRPTVGQQSAYISGKTCWPFVGRQTADKRPTVGQLSANRRPTVSRQVFWDALLHNYPKSCMRTLYCSINMDRKRLP